MAPDRIDALFQLPPAEFTAARNALVTTLKKEGDSDTAERVKHLPRPSVSAWVANQLYWRHRKAFDKLISAGEQFRKAQAAQLAGKSADLRAPLDARRAALGDLTKIAGEMLRDAGHPHSPDTMRRVMTTLEALATYGEHPEAPPAGRLTTDVDPPGFEALAALVPRDGVRGARGTAPSRIIPFGQPRPEPSRKKTAGSKEEARRLEAERRAKEAEVKKELQAAERALAEATRDAARARSAMKDAAAKAKTAEKAKAALESRFEKVSADAENARQHARRVANQAQEAAQAVEDAERTVRNVREKLTH